MRYIGGFQLERITFYTWISLCILLVLRNFTKSGVRSNVLGGVLVVFLSYLFIGIITALFAGYIQESISTLLSFIPVLLFLLLLSQINFPLKERAQLLQIYATLAVLSVPVFYFMEIELSTVVRERVIGNDFRYFIRRPSGLFANPNKAGFVINICSVLIILYRRYYNRIFVVIYLAMAALAVLMTLSKSGMIVALLILINYSLKHLSANWKNFIVIFSVILFSMNYLEDFLISDRFGELLNLFFGDINNVNFSERDIRSIGALQGVVDNPFGYGLGVNNMVFESHNEYFRFFIDTGIFFGLLISILLCGLILPILRVSGLAVMLLAFYALVSQNILNKEEFYFLIFMLFYYAQENKKDCLVSDLRTY